MPITFGDIMSKINFLHLNSQKIIEYKICINLYTHYRIYFLTVYVFETKQAIIT